jgi:hypothetical protein
VKRPFFRFPFVFMALVFFSLWIFAEFGGISRNSAEFGGLADSAGGILHSAVFCGFWWNSAEFGGILRVAGFRGFPPFAGFAGFRGFSRVLRDFADFLRARCVFFFGGDGLGILCH